MSNGILIVMEAKRVSGNLYKIERRNEVTQAMIVSEAASDPTHLWNQ